MTKEKSPSERMLEKAYEFARLEKGVNLFTLKGIDVPTFFETFICIFPDLISTQKTDINMVGTKIVDAKSIYKKILDLELPDRLKNIPVKDDEDLSRGLKRHMAMRGLPALMVALGKTQEKNEEVIVLFSVAGISPETGLKEVKKRIKERLSRLTYHPN